MGTYRKEWDCCGSVTETQAWEPEHCPFCDSASAQPDRGAAKAPAALESDQVVCKIARENGAPIAIETARKIIAALAASPASTPEASPASQPVAPSLTVWYGLMPESNGKRNFTATLKRKGASFFDTDSYTFAQSEYPDRVRYEADCMRYLIGEISERPDILDYDADKHSGYVAPVAAVAPSDAKGKEDAANAGARVAAFKAAFHAAHRQGGCYDDAVATGLSAADQFNVPRAADAANAGASTLKSKCTTVSISGDAVTLIFNESDQAVLFYEELLADIAPATNAADAKDAERLDLLLNISGFRFEIIGQKQHLLDARGRIAGIGSTKRDAIDAAIAATQQAAPVAKGEITDAEMLDHLEAWHEKGKARGFAWNSYDFKTGDVSIRQQLTNAVRRAAQQAQSSAKGGDAVGGEQ